MNNEQKTEIIKSLAMEMFPKKIADYENAAISETKTIRKNYSSEISERKIFYENH